jgi:hypothetical protein
MGGQWSVVKPPILTVMGGHGEWPRCRVRGRFGAGGIGNTEGMSQMKRLLLMALVASVIVVIPAGSAMAAPSSGCNGLNDPALDNLFTSSLGGTDTFSAGEVLTFTADLPTAGAPSGIALFINFTQIDAGPFPGSVSYTVPADGSYAFGAGSVGPGGSPFVTWNVECVVGADEQYEIVKTQIDDFGETIQDVAGIAEYHIQELLVQHASYTELVTHSQELLQLATQDVGALRSASSSSVEHRNKGGSSPSYCRRAIAMLRRPAMPILGSAKPSVQPLSVSAEWESLRAAHVALLQSVEQACGNL